MAQKLNIKFIFIILLVVCGAGLIVLLQTKDSTFAPPGDPQLGKGTLAPNFTLPDLTGKSVNLTDYRGKVVLLNIWATWCPPCVEEMPSLEKLYQEMKGEPFEILAVSLDETGAEVVAPFMKKHKLNFPALIDSAGTLKKSLSDHRYPREPDHHQRGCHSRKNYRAKKLGFLRRN